MDKKAFKISIDASTEKVWVLLWSETAYLLWTTPFSEGSHAETDWQKGSKAIFFNKDNQGMVSVIKDNIPNKYMSIMHLGMIKNGVEDLENKQTKEWADSEENYTLDGENGKTNLTVEIDMLEKYEHYFINTWPKALELIKKYAAQQN